MNSNDSGYNTITVCDNRTCSLVAEISGELPDWGGAFSLLIEGEPDLDASGGILGEITITRYRTGQDTTQAVGIWTGIFELSSKVAMGDWYTVSGELLTAVANGWPQGGDCHVGKTSLFS